MCSIVDGVQKYRGTLSVQFKKCSNIEAHYQYNQGCEVTSRPTISTNEGEQYKRVEYQVLVQGGGALLKRFSSERIITLSGISSKNG